MPDLAVISDEEVRKMLLEIVKEIDRDIFKKYAYPNFIEDTNEAMRVRQSLATMVCLIYHYLHKWDVDYTTTKK